MSTIAVFSQTRRDALWCFGDSSQIDFNQNPPEFNSCSAVTRGTACSIADSSGNLLFYTHTLYLPLWLAGYDRLGVIWNSNGAVMENGDSLVGEGWYQEMVIVPNPSNSNQYFLFHSGININGQIFYSLIDLSYNNGLGKVIQKNVLLDSLNGFFVTDGITAIKHGNGRDWWLMFRIWNGPNNNTFYKFLISTNGISASQIQNIGTNTNTNTVRLEFNNKGDKLIVYDNWSLLELFDFDRCTGQLSNKITIHIEDATTEDSYWSACFSSSDSILYVSSLNITSYLYQFDLTALNILSTKRLIDSIPYPYGAGGDIKLAPDGNIYWACAWSDSGSWNFPYPSTAYYQENMNLSVVNDPNNFGFSCNYQRFGFSLEGTRVYWGLPNNPNYDLEALGGSVCDTLGYPNEVDVIEKPQASLNVFYHAEWETAFLNASDLKGKNYSLHIIGIDGKNVFEESGSLNSEYFTKNFHCYQITSGTYLILMETEKERLVRKLMIE